MLWIASLSCTFNTHTHKQNRRNCWNVDTFIIQWERPNATKWKREMKCGESNQPISNAHGAIPFWLLVFIKSISLLLSSSCSIHFVYLFLLIYLSSFLVFSLSYGFCYAFVWLKCLSLLILFSWCGAYYLLCFFDVFYPFSIAHMIDVNSCVSITSWRIHA